MRGAWSGFFLVLLATGGEAAVVAEHAAVATPDRWATTAALQILRGGGSAADAAVAAAFTLSVLRPESTGIGGGGTALYFDAPSGEVWALDFRPHPANPAYLEVAMPADAPSLAVPGFVAGLAELQRKFGTRSWASLFEPAIAVAKDIHPHLDRIREMLQNERLAREIDTMPLVQHERMQQLPALLARLAEHGGDDLYTGQIARQLVARSRELGGPLTPRALAEYAPRWKSPVRIEFRGEHLYTFAAPAGSATVLTDMISILSGFDWSGIPADDPAAIHLFVEVERRGWERQGSALSERGTIARPTTTPAEELASVRRMIEQPDGGSGETLADPHHDSLGLVVIDESGSIAILSLSLGARFGSGRLFDQDTYFAESVEETASSPDLPMLVIRNGNARLGIVASGSGRETLASGRVYLRSRLFGMPLETLVSLPRFMPGAQPRTVICERGTPLSMVDRLNRIGQGVEWDDEAGLVHAIETNDSILVISDPRGGTAGGY